MLDPLYNVITWVLLKWHALWDGAGLDGDSGTAWGLAIVGLVVTMRVILFPLFMKQIRSQRAMQALQPKVKELQTKHKGDRETLNREVMALYKEHNANPLMGCLPLLLQMPVFFALFHVLRRLEVGRAPLYGWTQDLIDSAATAHIFGAPISATFTESADDLRELDATPTSVRIVAVVMVILMAASTYYTQRQMIARSQTTDPNQLMVQRLMLYVIPASFAVSGTFFPIGVLLYWLTTNIWSMGQQAYVIRRMPPALGGEGVGAKPTPKTPAGGSSGVAVKPAKNAKPQAGAPVADGAAAGPVADAAAASVATTPAAGPQRRSGKPGRPSGSKKKSGRKGGRR